jgi:hypothetical protein
MQKLRLSLERLQVESFHPDGAVGARGTVPGYGFTEYADESCFQSCNGFCSDGTCNTCDASCYGSCAVTCGTTCGASCGCPGTGYTECGCATWETCPNATICA